MRAWLAAGLLVLASAAPAGAQSLRGVRKEFAEIGKKVIPATVIVRASGAAQYIGGSSGVVVHEDGYVLSDADATLTGFEMEEDGKTAKKDENGQLIKIHGDSAKIRMPAPDHRVFSAKLILRDAETDTSLLKITDPIKEKLPAVSMGSSDHLRVGSFSVAVGNTFGSGSETEPALSMGIVSALPPRDGGVGGRWETIYTSATVVNGSNGGPLVDKEGRLVGIISTRDFKEESAYRGLGVVTPIDKIRPRYRGKEGFAEVFPDPATIRPQSREAGILEDAFALIARRAWPSIVSIEVTRAEGTKQTTTEMRSGQREDGSQGMMPQEVPRYTGPFSGVVLTADGQILTSTWNLWSFDKIESVTVHLPDGRALPAKVLGRDLYKRLALLKVEAEGLAPLPRATEKEVEVGRIALALGNPFGKDRAEYPLLTFGLLGGTNRLPDTLGALLTDAGLNDAMAGGALVTIDGKLLGVTVIESPEYYGRMSGVGFAIPLETIDDSVPKLAKGRTLSRGWMGIGWGRVPKDGKLVIGTVVKGGPAEKGGVLEGDVLLAVDGRSYEASDFQDLSKFFSLTSPGQTIKVTVMRGAETKELRIVLGTPPD